jgi:hypothetical protein
VPKGRYNKGWDRFALEFCLADNFLRARQTSHTKQLHMPKDPKVEMKWGRRSYAKVLESSLSALKEPFGYPLPFARVPRWLKASSEEAGAKAVQRPTTMAISALVKGFKAQEKAPTAPAIRICLLAKTTMVKATPTLNCGPHPSVSPATLGLETPDKDLGVASCKTYFGESFDLLNLRKTLLTLQEEIALSFGFGFV